MFCSNCGKKLSDQENFCPACGAPVDREDDASGQSEASAAVKSHPKKAKKRKRRRWPLLVLAVLIVSVFAALSLPAEEEAEKPEPPDVTAELLSCINQAEDLHSSMAEQFSAVSAEEVDTSDGLTLYVAQIRQEIQILEDFLTDLAVLQEQAGAIKLGSKLRSARDEYFTMLRDSRSAHVEALTFLADYMEFFDQVVCCRPVDVDYDTVEEYAQALNEWIELTRKGRASISCPACMKSEWNRYVKTLEYNAAIVQKVEEASSRGDWLRYYSAKNMTARYHTVESTLYGKLISSLEGETNHANRQQNIASSLAKEIRAYAELEEPERTAYEFKYIRTGQVWLDYDAIDTIYPSLYNTYDAFLIIKTGCVSGTSTILVEAEIPGLTQKYRETHRLDSSYQVISIKPPALTGDLNLTAAKSAQISVNIYREDQSLLDAKTFPVNLKSKYDFEWYSDEYGTSTQDNILCLLTPESTSITRLRRNAIDEITDITGSQMESFVGYLPVNSDWDEYTTTYLQAAGLMSALYNMGVRYNMDTFSISGSGQHILFPEDVLAERSGLCVETSLVIASALQSAGMHAFLIFPPNHAQVAVEVWNRGDCAGEYYLIETTALTKATNNRNLFIQNANKVLEGKAPTGVISYMNADGWYKYLKDEVEYVVDCSDSRVLGLTSFAN